MRLFTGFLDRDALLRRCREDRRHAEVGGYIADAATTILLPPIAPVAARLKQSAVDALRMGLAAARQGERVSVIGRAISAQAQKDGFAVVRELCGHGVGRSVHEPPQVSNFDDPLCSDWLTEGLVIAVEPMLLASSSQAINGHDGWTIRSRSGAIAVHEEHTIVIRDGAP
jgi:methionyl aminopeptidase